MYNKVTKLSELTLNNDFGVPRTKNPLKTINTGTLHKFVRVSDNFIVLEKVLCGFKHTFTDGVQIFTKDGCFVAELFSIRDLPYGPDASMNLVRKQLRKYLHTDENIDTYLDAALVQLYDTDYQKLEFARAHRTTKTIGLG